jgi:DNA-directed RNA polymerase specialized sigma24 family protein
VLAYNDGMSHPEIAALTGFPLGTVKSHISRGAARVREMLVDYEGS